MEAIIDLGEQYGADRVWLNKIEDWGTMDDFRSQDIWGSTDYQNRLEKVIGRIHDRGDRFIECPTLISEAVRIETKTKLQTRKLCVVSHFHCVQYITA